MMKTTLKFLTYSLFVVALIFTSCDGEDGMNGADGLQGEQGATGQDGEDGTDGNADVMYSDWIPADFTGSSASVKFMRIDFPPELPESSQIKNTHIILVYFTGFGDGNVYLLPVLNFRGAQFTYGYGSGSTNAGDIFVTAEALNGNLTEVQIDPDRGAKFRYVIIPPTININGKSANLSGLDILKEHGVDINNYHQVIDFYGLDY